MQCAYKLFFFQTYILISYFHSILSEFVIILDPLDFYCQSPLHVEMPKVQHMTKMAMWFLPETYWFDVLCAQFSNAKLCFFPFLFGMVDNILSTLWKTLCSSNSHPSSNMSTRMLASPFEQAITPLTHGFCLCNWGDNSNLSHKKNWFNIWEVGIVYFPFYEE